MKHLSYDIEFFKRDRRVAIHRDGDTRFEFKKSDQRDLRRAKRVERRGQRRAGKIEANDWSPKEVAL